MNKQVLLMAVVLVSTLAIYSCNSGEATNTATEQDRTVEVDKTTTDSIVPKPVKTQTTELIEQKLGDKHVSMELTKGMQVEDLGGFLLICSSEVVHEARCFTIEPYNGKDVYSGWSQQKLTDDRVIFYSMNDVTTNADGHPEQEMTAYLTLGTSVYLVKCADVALTGGIPDPKWCFPYLSTFEYVEGV